MKKQNILITLMLVFLLAACSPGNSNPDLANEIRQDTQQPPDTDPSKPAFTMLNRDKFSSYTSSFLVQFEGPSSWKYQLKTRKSADLHEVSLHIEGIDASANPGDVRLVTNGMTTWMIGPGTDNECVEFPNNQGMDPTLLYPETLFPEKDLAGLLANAGEETLSGIASLHFTGSAPAAGGWQDVRVEVWQDKGSQGLLRYTMQASGEDPFFKKGTGRLSAHYEAGALDVAQIEPVQGCTVSVPLPDTASNYVRLPGMASFESSAGLEDMRAFYQAQLPQEGWVEKEPPEQAEGALILSYQRNNESVEIQIRGIEEGGSKIQLIFLQAS